MKMKRRVYNHYRADFKRQTVGFIRTKYVKFSRYQNITNKNISTTFGRVSFLSKNVKTVRCITQTLNEYNKYWCYKQNNER